MKRITKVLLVLGFGLLLASFLIVDAPLGLFSVGVWSFAYIYDDEFRRKFL